MTSEQEDAVPDEDRGGAGQEGLGGLVRRVLSPHPTAEERLEQLLAERRRELAEQAAIVEQTLDDLERREERLRDARASIDRLLRLGQRDLDLRESDLVHLGRELTERESRLDEQQAELHRRRAELGAVELQRAALEQRDRALAAREADLTEQEARLDERKSAVELDPAPPTAPDEAPQLVFVPGRSYRLLEIEHAPTTAGASLELDGAEYVVARVGPSPLPGDRRRCAYLVCGGPERASSGSS